MFVSYTAQAALLLATSGEGLALVTAVLAAVAAAISTCIAAWQGVLMKSSERKRTQPIVVAYERADPTREGDDLIFAVSLANAGVGPAFNIRFGITLDGVESAYRAQPAGAHRAGDVPRALGPGRTLPPDGADPYRWSSATPQLRALVRLRNASTGAATKTPSDAGGRQRTPGSPTWSCTSTPVA